MAQRKRHGRDRKPGDRPRGGSGPRESRPGKGESPQREQPRGEKTADPPGKAAQNADRNKADRNKAGTSHDRGRKGDRRPSPWLYGMHAVCAALANPDREIKRLVATRGAAEQIEKQGITPKVPVEIADRDALDALLPPGTVHQGIALLAGGLPGRHIEDLVATAKKTDRTAAVALDQVTDPQNVGAVLRSAAAFGVAGVILTEHNAPEATGALAKAASGALETVPLIRPSNLVRGLETLKLEGFWVVGLDMEARDSIDEIDLPARCVFALGAEGPGLRRLTRETCDMMVRVPMVPGAIESLNVSASAAVALYEWHRQGRKAGP